MIFSGFKMQLGTILIVLIAELFCTSTPAFANPSCIDLFSSDSDASQTLEMLLANPQLVVHYEDKDVPNSFSIKKVIKLATSLNLKEQQNFLSYLDGLPFDNNAGKSLRMYLRLALKHELTWLDVTQGIKRNGLQTVIQSEFGHVVSNLPDSLKSKMINEIRFNYLTAVEAKNRDSKLNRHFGAAHGVSAQAKRAYEFILRYLFRYEVQLEKDIRSKISPEKALSEYFEKSRAQIPSLASNPFDAPAVLEVAHKISRLLVSESSTETIYISGSVMTAHFVLGVSDIDLLLKNGLNYDDPLRWKIESLFKDFFNSKKLKAPQIRMSQSYSEIALSKMSILTPVILKISAQGISLLIYPPQPDGEAAFNKKIDFYEKPAEFLIESN